VRIVLLGPYRENLFLPTVSFDPRDEEKIMNHKRFLGAATAALMIVIVILMLVPGAGAASKYKVLHKFALNGKDGKLPLAGLILDVAGNLYGTTYIGGAYGYGVVFRLSPNGDGSWAESVVHSFTAGADGGFPWAGLVFDQAGNLYGTTGGGGNSSCSFDHGCGVVFELAPNADGSWTESVLYTFTGGSDGEYPRVGLIFDQAGNLYSTTADGGAYGYGVVFMLAPNADGCWTESVLHSFTGGSDGKYPGAGLIFDAAGNLYGTTQSGGNLSYCGGQGCGVVFRLTPNSDGSWKEKVLHQFTGGKSGSGPSGLILDAAGNLYSTAGGGAYGAGVAFRLAPNSNGGWKEKVLHQFTGGKDGNGPSGLTLDPSGNLYGTTHSGGNSVCYFGSGCGVVFMLTADSNGGWHEKPLHAFKNNPGAFPDAGVILDGAGNLYGTTSNYASGECEGACGSVFEVTP
jgi:uncharacterized repeat protein (TIGR03803 family)